MANSSGIEWTDATWSPITGCTKVSQGCKHCYAEREVVTRWSKNPKSVWYGREFTDVQCHMDKLNQPLHWKKPRKIFVCPRADLFHEDIDDAFIDRVFAVMALAPQHTFQVLTKRAKRMQSYLGGGGRAAEVFHFMRNSELGYWAGAESLPPQAWPLPNVWLGVSAENQQMANGRIPLLLETPAAVRFVSAEPLIGKLDICESLSLSFFCADRCEIDWLIAGGESGPDARPSLRAWFQLLRDHCGRLSIPFFFKQWGEYSQEQGLLARANQWRTIDETGLTLREAGSTANMGPIMHVARIGKRAAGRMLDGVEHSEFPR